MWGFLMEILPDLTAGAFEARDLLSLVMAGLGAYLAWQAIKVGREQVASAKRQEGLAEQMKAMSEEQAGIAREQAAIVKAQHEVMQQQFAQRSLLAVVCDPEDQDQSSKDEYYKIPVYVRNDGKLSVQEFTWFIFGPIAAASNAERATMNRGPEVGSSGGWSGHYDKPISAHQFRSITMLRISRRFVNEEGGVTIAWYIDTPNARYPENAEYGYEVITQSRFKPDDT
jgi:hypothetical protein